MIGLTFTIDSMLLNAAVPSSAASPARTGAASGRWECEVTCVNVAMRGSCGPMSGRTL